MNRLVFVFSLFFLAGCVSPSPALNDQVPLPPTSNENPPVQTPVVDLIQCTASGAHDREECFEDAFASCQKVSAVFWETPDGFELRFESKGFDDAGNCLVHVSVDDSASQFAGQSADCVIVQTPADDEHASPYFDVYLIGMDTCTGTYTDTIVTSAAPVPPQTSPAPSLKEYSFTVDDDGVVGAKEFFVSKGDTVRLTISVSTSNVSFGGAWTRAPAGPKLSSDADYIFTTGNVSPGGSKTIEFTANTSFEFGIYWPGSNVLKGKGKITTQN